VTSYFTEAQIARSDEYFARARWPSRINLVIGLLAPVVLGFTTAGRFLVVAVRRRIRRWEFQVVGLAVVILGVQRLATLPGAIWSERVARAYGLSTRNWASWTLDVVKAWGLGVLITSVVLLLLVGLARRFTRSWFLAAAVGAAALVVGGSFAYPVVIEPAFSRFTSLSPGPLRDSLLAMAQRDDVKVSEVLVADASRRTTALNAYVSGFGSTKRIVIYDTLLRSQTPDRQIELIVAHELGHARRDDVLLGTLEGAAGSAAGVFALFIALKPERLRRKLGAGSVGDPAIVPVVLALVAVASFLSLPVQNTISRHIEARADLHSLELTRDPDAFIEMQQRLAVTNLSHLKPNPVLSFWFSSHPPALVRIALAQQWQRQRAS
jgi:STE24 endopeptidase